jgi:mannose-6-phosphate isomerase-like protein (cupin superfamily)
MESGHLEDLSLLSSRSGTFVVEEDDHERVESRELKTESCRWPACVSSARDTGGMREQPKAYWFLGSLVIVHASGKDTSGRFLFTETLLPPGAWQPLHLHRREDQCWLVLEGEMTFYVPGAEKTCRPGESAFGPMGVPHTHRVISPAPARIAEVNSPAGFEEFLIAVGQPAATLELPTLPAEPPDLDRIAGIARRFGIDVLGPPGTLP